MDTPSIRSRILDLLGTFRDEWMIPERLLLEYTIRWGEVNPESFRRTLTRVVNSDSDVVEARHVEGVFSVNDNLELRMTSEAYWSLVEDEWDDAFDPLEEGQVA